MNKRTLFVFAFCLILSVLSVERDYAGISSKYLGTKIFTSGADFTMPVDTVPPDGVMEVIKLAIYSTNNFSIEAVANLYTPNAVISDDEPPYSWNGPTAGVQWVNAVERSCKDNRLTKLKGSIEPISVFQQTTDNVYIVVPVSYTGNLPAKQTFTAEGAFTFVLRMINGKWMIKSQAWVPKKALY